MVVKYFPKNAHVLRLKETARKYFKSPMGILLTPNDKTAEEKFSERFGSTFHKGTPLIAVGDVVAETLMSVSIIPNVTILDFKTLRDSNLQIIIPDSKVIKVKNLPAEISREAWVAIKDLFHSFQTSKKRICVQVEGEEDLLAIPVALEAPLNSLMVYGQPGEGIVVVNITKPLKKSIEELLTHFDPFP